MNYLFGTSFLSSSGRCTKGVYSSILRFKDKDGKYWYPNSVILDDKSMVFAEGTNVQDWMWSAVQAKDGKTDMTTKKEFQIHEFMDALEYIDYFKYAQRK